MNYITIILFFGIFLIGCQKEEGNKKKINPQLIAYTKERELEFPKIDKERKEQLKQIGKYIKDKAKNRQKAHVVMICTHNSRRSHMAQFFGKLASLYYGVQDVETYSGGTESTAFNPRAVKALKEAGFEISTSDPNENPKYEVRLGGDLPPIIAFSKKYDDETNPKSNFIAIMTCSQADKTCPIVKGAEKRVAIPYDDPKEFDGTEKEEEMYKERAGQIAREMLFVFKDVKNRVYL